MNRTKILLWASLLLLPIIGAAQTDALWQAIKACEPTKAKSAIEAGADLKALDANGRTPLLATISGEGIMLIPERQKKIASDLIAAGADVNAKDSKGLTALHYAAYHGNFDLVGLLLENEAQTAVLSEYGEAPLILAARGQLLNQDRIETFHVLLEANCDPNIKDQTNKTALHWICNHLTKSETPATADQAILEIVKLLIEKGAKFQDEDSDGITPLAYAVIRGHQQTTLWLLEKGANPNAKALGEFNGIHFATERGQLPLIDKLIQLGLDINAPTNAKQKAEDKAYFFPKGSSALDIARISEYEAKDSFIKKEWKGMITALKSRGARSFTFDEYVKGFKVMKGPKSGGSSKIR